MAYYGYKSKVLGKTVTPFTKYDKKLKKRLLLIGDSTVYGVGTTSSDCSYGGQIAHDFPNYEIHNRAKNAAKVSDLMNQIDHFPPHFFDHTIIFIGGMDTLHFTTKRKLMKTFKSLSTKLHILTKGSVVIVSVNNVGTVPFMLSPLKQLYTWRSRKVSSYFSEIANENGFTHVPLFREKAEDEFTKDTKQTLALDCIHPNDNGYRLLYRSFLYPTLKNSL
ncbi:MAG: GDSL-type esterase/lipase family protein [Candidatus Paceibacterota bacterium]